VGDIYYTNSDRFGWLREQKNAQTWDFVVFRDSLEKDMALSVFSILQYLNKHYAPDYRLHDDAEQKIIQIRLKASQQELANLHRAVRSWPAGRPHLGKPI
jgi:hypothetical protein